MIKYLVAAAVLCASAATVSPAFASSGYGPAPHYNPFIGAPASQRGQSALTIRAEEASVMADADVTTQSYGGRRDTTSQSGGRIAPHAPRSLYTHH